MPKKNDFKLDVVSVRLVKDAPIYSEHTFNWEELWFRKKFAGHCASGRGIP